MFLDAAIEFLRARYGYALVALGAFALGAFVGWLHEHDKLTAYQASVEAIAQAQERHNAEIIKKHNETKQQIHDDYKKRLSDLRSYYNDRMREQDSSRVSPSCAASSRTNGSPSNPEPLATTVEKCAETTLQLKELQDWVRRTR